MAFVMSRWKVLLSWCICDIQRKLELVSFTMTSLLSIAIFHCFMVSLCLAAGNVLKFILIVAAGQEVARCTNDLRPKLVGNYFELPAPSPLSPYPPPPLSVVIFVTGQEIELKPTSVVQMAIKASTTASLTMLSLDSFANGKEEQILEIKYNCLDNV